MLRTPLFLLALGGALCFAGGCRDAGQVVIKGMVTFDGAVVEEGSISFYPEDGGDGRKASAPIVNGVFEIPAERAPSPGRFKIDISWMKKTGGKIPNADPGMPDVDERKEAIPAKYNTASTLVRDIVVGENKLEFTLEP